MSLTLPWRRTRRTIRDRRLDREVTEVGYGLIEGGARDDVAELREIFDSTHTVPEVAPAQTDDSWRVDPRPGPRFINDLEFPFEMRDRVEELLNPFWDRIIPEHFIGQRRVVSTFLMKWPGESQLTMHQDPTLVDERRARSLTIWVALDDADVERRNGPLYVLPRSHVVGDEYRGTHTPSTYFQFLDPLWDHAVPISVRAGDILVIDGRVIHGSPPNWTDKPRLAVVTQIIPEDATLIHAVGDGGERVVIHEVAENFYRRSSPGRLHADPPPPPDGAEFVPRAPRPFTIEALSS